MNNIFRIIQNKQFIQKGDKFVSTNLKKYFDGDILINEKLKYSPIRNRTLIGIFSTVKCFNKKGNKTYYEVKTLINNIPNFIVSYGGKEKGKLIIIFKFLSWNEKLPKGTIIDIIGKYSEDNLEKALLYHYQIFPKRNRFMIEKDSNFINKNESKIKRNIVDRVTAITVDPKGSEDRDDALSIIEDSDFTYLGIHIAQPIVYLDEKEILETGNNRFSTLYMSKNKNLWNNKITEISSLTEGKKNYAYSVIFKIHKNTKRIIKTLDYPTILTKIINLDYENKDNEILNLILQRTKEYDSTIKNTKEMVSYWMVKANHYIGMKLKEVKGYKLPYRVNKRKDFSKLNIPKDKIKIFENRLYESAEYSVEDFEHQSLNLEFYTHFTSPIRRAVDTVIHYYLTYNIKINLDLDKINFLEKQIKKFHRNLILKDKLINLNNDTIIEAYLFKVKNPNLWEVYTDELGFVIMELFNGKFQYQFEFIEKDNNFIVKNKDGIEYIFEVGKKINVKLIKTTNIFPNKSFKIIPVDCIF
jgi:exoribonuclease R